MASRLSRDTLDSLPATVGRPRYHAADLSPGIVHFGVGNFHRAHQGHYLDRLFERGIDHDWGVVGAGIMPGDQRLRQVLLDQDYLTLLVSRSADTNKARIIAPMLDYLPVGDESAIVGALTNPAIRIVSLTVTEGGYFLDSHGRFDPTRAEVRADAAAPDRPGTVFGMILKALRLRRDDEAAPFTVMSCDNMPHNGTVARGTVAGLARLYDPAFADWVEANVSFPNAMVDRITPSTSDREREIAREDFRVEDGWPVFCEDFAQWVLEDDFTSGRPAWEAVGATFVKDVTPYEQRKLRLLNASHAIIAYPAALCGTRYAHEAIANPKIKEMLDKIQREEIMPGVRDTPDMTSASYYEQVCARFANSAIPDTVERLCYDGGNRQPKFIVPAISDALRDGRPTEGLALASALWCSYCAGVRDDGEPIARNDPQWDRLHGAALRAKEDAGEWLALRDVYGDVGESDVFRSDFARSLDAVGRHGALGAAAMYVGGLQD